MRVGEFIFECLQRGNKTGGLSSKDVTAIAKILREELRYYDSSQNPHPGKRDQSVSDSLDEICSALEKIWVRNPRGLRLHQLTSQKLRSSNGTAHTILHKNRDELVKVLDNIFTPH